MNSGTFNNLVEAIATIPNGRFFKMCYCTELPLKAEFKHKGWKILKYTFRVTRTGIDYRALKIDSDDIIKNQHKNTRWILKNKIKYNAYTGKYYLIIAPMKSGEHKEYLYKIVKPDGSYVIKHDYDKDMVIDSYSTKSNGPIRNITFENIEYIKFGGKIIYSANDFRGDIINEQ